MEIMYELNTNWMLNEEHKSLLVGNNEESSKEKMKKKDRWGRIT